MFKVIECYEWVLLLFDKVDDLQVVLGKMDEFQVWDFELRIKEVFFKFKIEDFNQVVGIFFGGQCK